jgi:glycosyltransferase involved in cell wall biosynthesis
LFSSTIHDEEVFIKPCRPYGSVLMILSGAVSDFRMILAARWLIRAGYGVEVIQWQKIQYYKASQHDMIICSRPNPAILMFLNTCIKAGVPVIIDLDDDFYSIPAHSPAYFKDATIRKTYHEALQPILENCKQLVYASKELANRYKREGVIIPNCFDEENKYWFEPKLKSDYTRLLVSGTPTHREDFKIIQPVLNTILKDHDDIQLVVNVDYELYKQFAEIPEQQKLFLPGVPYEVYPLIFKFADILLVPLQDDYFNKAKSDIKLIEAGATHTPWIASPLPQYKDWDADEVSGCLADNEQAWIDWIDYYCKYPDLAAEESAKGYKLAQERTSEKVCKGWIELIRGIL